MVKVIRDSKDNNNDGTSIDNNNNSIDNKSNSNLEYKWGFHDTEIYREGVLINSFW